MRTIPEYRAEESWDQSGDVDIWFEDNTSSSVREAVKNELPKALWGLGEDQRTVYHVESAIDSIFYRMKNEGKLIVNNNVWVVKGK